MHQRGLAAARALPADGATPTETTPTGAEQAGVATTPEVDSFTKLDPSSIPPELKPYYDSMQADYTRKTQAIAPYRALAETQGLDVSGLTQAAELYSTLQDPQRLVEFYGELTQALEAQGLTPREAQAAATEHIASQATAPPAQGEYVDPEEQRIAALEARLAGFETQAQAAAQAQAQERMQMAVLAEMNRQEGVVKESHPNWDQEDMDAVYELSTFYGGDLIQAASRLDEYTSSKITKILNGKGAAANGVVVPPPSGASTRGLGFGDDLDAAHRAAMAAARALPVA